MSDLVRDEDGAPVGIDWETVLAEHPEWLDAS